MGSFAENQLFLIQNLRSHRNEERRPGQHKQNGQKIGVT